jgi:hypothetical protein
MSFDCSSEFQECIDELYELFQKYGNTHKIVIGRDINEDLNKAANNKRSKYLWEFINDCHLELHCIFSEPSSNGLIIWSMCFLHIMATPP